MNEDALEGLKAIAHPLRYVILDALAGGETNVGELEASTGILQPALSQQLSVLRKAGLVSTRREAKLVFYRLDCDALAASCGAVTRLIPAADTAEPAPASAHGRHTGAAVFARIEPD